MFSTQITEKSEKYKIGISIILKNIERYKETINPFVLLIYGTYIIWLIINEISAIIINVIYISFNYFFVIFTYIIYINIISRQTFSRQIK